MSQSLLAELFVQAKQACNIEKDSTGNTSLSTIKALVVVDENALGDIALLAHSPFQTHVITNRWDIYDQCLANAVACQFNDFELQNHSFDIAMYRISKERFVSHHILNALLRNCHDNAKVWITGRKNEGIKTYFDKCKKTFACNGDLIKNKDTYSAAFSHISNKANKLDDKNYPEVRTISLELPNKQEKAFHVKPGAYGWNKTDKGSEFLISTLLENGFFQASESSQKNSLETTQKNSAEAVLDLGCGTGYLSFQYLAQLTENSLPFPKVFYATDNNAAALRCCHLNLRPYTDDIAEMQITSDDAGTNIKQQFDLILCNPPFHQGFDTSRELSQKFIASTKSLLKQNGSAFFVVNSFIPVESLCKDVGLKVRSLANNKQFKVLRLSKT